MTRQEEAEAMVDGTHIADDVNYIVGKFIRDFVVNLAAVLPIFVAEQEVSVEMLAPAFGLALYRTVRAMANRNRS